MFRLLSSAALALLLISQAHADATGTQAAEIRNNLQDWCTKNPQACEQKKAQMQQRVAKFKAWCEANPQPCTEKKAKWRQKAADMKAKCDADPAACEQKKARWRERLQQRLNQQP